MRGYHSNGACSVFLMISERTNSQALDQLPTHQLSAARVRLILQPGAIAGPGQRGPPLAELQLRSVAAKLLLDGVLITGFLPRSGGRERGDCRS